MTIAAISDCCLCQVVWPQQEVMTIARIAQPTQKSCFSFISIHPNTPHELQLRLQHSQPSPVD
ncbi:hypothetical protein [Phormidium nigroviride]|uniref:hypothetical protein n=1 Tax=Phormidium nigroviride TaxID=482564 RepID=UPI0012375342|nr:hypothetical protein [Oscillatoria nigro-viridis]